MKTVALFLLGGIGGALAAYTLAPDRLGRRVAESGMMLSDPASGASRGGAGPADATIEAEAAIGSAFEDSIEALTRRAEDDPARALTGALDLPDPGARRRALHCIGTIWARTDPVAALAQVSVLPRDARAAYVSGVTTEWASRNPTSFLAYADASASLGELADGLLLLVATEPVSVLEIVARQPTSSSNDPMFRLQTAAMSALAERDPEAALASLETLPQGVYNTFLRAVASGYVRHDPDAALAWLETPAVASSRLARRAVIAEIAATDMQRAVELLSQNLDPLIGGMLARDSDRAREFADILVLRGDDSAGFALASLMTAWSARDAQHAIEWMLANGTRVPAELVALAAQSVAALDFGAAVRYLDRVSPAQRAAAIPQVAGIYAREDPVAAASWIARYLGNPGYDAALTQVVRVMAESDAPAAAALLETANPGVFSSVANFVSSNWARQNPTAAAGWVLGIEESGMRASALNGFVYSWNSIDRDQARNWVLDLPSGAMRDDALQTLIGESFQRADFDSRLFEALSADRLRERAASSLITRMPYRDGSTSGYAQHLLDTFVSDPELRKRGEVSVEQMRQAGK